MKNARILLFVVAAFAVSSCATPIGSGSCPKRGKIEHIVLAWLKNPKSSADRAKFVACIHSLKAQIKEIKTLEIGSGISDGRNGAPANAILPPINQHSDIGFVMTFDTQAEFESYEANPIHKNLKSTVLGPLSKVIEINTFSTK